MHHCKYCKYINQPANSNRCSWCRWHFEKFKPVDNFRRKSNLSPAEDWFYDNYGSTHEVIELPAGEMIEAFNAG